jgi:hypothetical protein
MQPVKALSAIDASFHAISKRIVHDELLFMAYSRSLFKIIRAFQSKPPNSRLSNETDEHHVLEMVGKSQSKAAQSKAAQSHSSM